MTYACEDADLGRVGCRRCHDFSECGLVGSSATTPRAEDLARLKIGVSSLADECLVVRRDGVVMLMGKGVSLGGQGSEVLVLARVAIVAVAIHTSSTAHLNTQT